MLSNSNPYELEDEENNAQRHASQREQGQRLKASSEFPSD